MSKSRKDEGLDGEKAEKPDQEPEGEGEKVQKPSRRGTSASAHEKSAVEGEGDAAGVMQEQGHLHSQHFHAHLHFGGDSSAVHQNPHAGFSRPPQSGGVVPMHSASQQGISMNDSHPAGAKANAKASKGASKLAKGKK